MKKPLLKMVILFMVCMGGVSQSAMAYNGNGNSYGDDHGRGNGHWEGREYRGDQTHHKNRLPRYVERVNDPHEHAEQNVELNRMVFESITADPDPIVVYGEPRGSKIEFLRTGDSTCGKYLYAKVTVPPGSGPPPHIHHRTDEWFYVPNGGAVMFHGSLRYMNINWPPDRTIRDKVSMIPMEKGYLMYGPRYRIHGYTNATDEPIEVHIIWTPDTPDASILGYFLSIYAPVFDDDNLNARFNSIQPIKAVSEARDYGMNFSHSFWQYIRDVEFVDKPGATEIDRLMAIIAEGDLPCN